MKSIINEFQFEYVIDYDKPIAVTEFTNSLNAIASEYKKILNDKYGSERPEAELFGQEIKNGVIFNQDI